MKVTTTSLAVVISIAVLTLICPSGSLATTAAAVPDAVLKRVDADDPHLTSPWSGGGIETPLYLTAARPTPIFIRTGRVAGIRLAAAHRLVSPMLLPKLGHRLPAKFHFPSLRRTHRSVQAPRNSRRTMAGNYPRPQLLPLRRQRAYSAGGRVIAHRRGIGGVLR